MPAVHITECRTLAATSQMHGPKSTTLTESTMTQVISLGTHAIDEAFAQPVLLMELMPSILAKRSFGPLRTIATLEPGYRDSPDPSKDLAIVFIKVTC